MYKKHRHYFKLNLNLVSEDVFAGILSLSC